MSYRRLCLPNPVTSTPSRAWPSSSFFPAFLCPLLGISISPNLISPHPPLSVSVGQYAILLYDCQLQALGRPCLTCTSKMTNAECTSHLDSAELGGILTLKVPVVCGVVCGVVCAVQRSKPLVVSVRVAPFLFFCLPAFPCPTVGPFLGLPHFCMLWSSTQPELERLFLPSPKKPSFSPSTLPALLPRLKASVAAHCQEAQQLLWHMLHKQTLRGLSHSSHRTIETLGSLQERES